MDMDSYRPLLVSPHSSDARGGAWKRGVSLFSFVLPVVFIVPPVGLSNSDIDPEWDCKLRPRDLPVIESCPVPSLRLFQVASGLGPAYYVMLHLSGLFVDMLHGLMFFYLFFFSCFLLCNT